MIYLSFIDYLNILSFSNSHIQDVNKRETLLSSHERVIRGLNSQITGLKEALVQHSHTMSQMKETYAEVGLISD